MTKKELPPIRDRSEIIPAKFQIGAQWMDGEAIQHEDFWWLVLTWEVVPDEGWMQPVRIVCVSGLEHEVQVDPPQVLLVVGEALPPDAVPPHDPLKTAERIRVHYFPPIRFQAHRKH